MFTGRMTNTYILYVCMKKFITYCEIIPGKIYVYIRPKYLHITSILIYNSSGITCVLCVCVHNCIMQYATHSEKL